MYGIEAIIEIIVIGATVLFVTYSIYMTWDYDAFDIRKKRANKALPSVAKKLGLKYLNPAWKQLIGGLSGKYKGFKVTIDPEDTAYIEIELPNDVAVHLSRDESPRSHMNKGMVWFDFDDKASNKFFGTRYASQNLVERIKSSEYIANFVKRANKSWGKKKTGCTYNNGYLRARFKSGFSSFVPTKHIEPAMNDLTGLASELMAL